MKKAFKNFAEMMHRADPSAAFAFQFWDGETVGYGEQASVVLRFNSPQGASRIMSDGFLGFGEAYMAGDIEVQGEMQELLRLGCCIGLDNNGVSLWQKLRFLVNCLIKRNTVKGSRDNIAHHYDYDNGFYSLYLDPTLSYSCAYFKNPSDSLEQAQLNKFEHIARKLRLKPGERLLDIGCGWGGMLIYAAQNHGVKGLGNTISKTQYEYARQQIKDLGLENQIDVVFEDYRNLSGRFDKVVSIGMFEHVGQEYISTFMKKIAGLLKEEGLGLLHTIGKDVESERDPWTWKYIFPGAYVPILHEIVREMGKSGFSVLDVENLRRHYARTLDHWADNFEANIDAVRKQLNDNLVRMWRLFFHSASVGFQYGATQLYQVLFSNGINNKLPMTRDHVYGH